LIVGLATPVIAGLAIGAGFVILISLVNTPVGLSMSEWDVDAPIPMDIGYAQSQKNVVEKFPVLKKGIENIEMQYKIGSPYGPQGYGDVLLSWQATQLRKAFPFSEITHPDEKYRTFAVIVDVSDDRMYIIELIYLS